MCGTLAQVADLGAFGRFLMLVGAHTGRVINLTEAWPGSRHQWSNGQAAGCRCSRQARSSTCCNRTTRTTVNGFARASSCICSIQDWPPFLRVCTRPRPVLSRPSLGALAETAVVVESVQCLPPDGEQALLYYWQLSTGAEVDLIIDRGGVLYGIEVKATATTTTPRRRARPLARADRSRGPWGPGLSRRAAPGAPPRDPGAFPGIWPGRWPAPLSAGGFFRCQTATGMGGFSTEVIRTTSVSDGVMYKTSASLS